MFCAIDIQYIDAHSTEITDGLYMLCPGTGVELAAWNGLSACCVVKGLGSAQLPTHDSQHGGGHSQQYSALTQTMSAMFRRLPGIPKWHAGENTPMFPVIKISG